MKSTEKSCSGMTPEEESKHLEGRKLKKGNENTTSSFLSKCVCFCQDSLLWEVQREPNISKEKLEEHLLAPHSDASPMYRTSHGRQSLALPWTFSSPDGGRSKAPRGKLVLLAVQGKFASPIWSTRGAQGCCVCYGLTCRQPEERALWWRTLVSPIGCLHPR